MDGLKEFGSAMASLFGILLKFTGLMGLRLITWAFTLLAFGYAIWSLIDGGEDLVEFIGKHKFLKPVLIIGTIVLIWKTGFSFTLTLVTYALDIYGIWHHIRENKRDKEYAKERAKEEEDKKKAETWCLEAQQFEKGTDGKTADPAQARDLYRQSAELGNKQAQYKYGWFCLKGIGGEKDPQKAFEYLMKADELDIKAGYDFDLERDTKYALGLCYSQGAGTKVNTSEALNKFSYASLHGDFNAAYQAGNIYKKRGNMDDAEDMYRSAAKRGHVPAMYQLALILMEKTGDLSAKEQALEIFQAVKRADASREADCETMIQKVRSSIAEEQQNEADAYFAAGVLETPDLNQSEALYDRAQTTLSRTQTIEECVDDFEAAAFGGYAPAQFLMGYLAAKGIGKNNNPQIALEWIRRATSQDYITDNLVDYAWIRSHDENLAARVLEIGIAKGSAFACYEQGHAAILAGNTEAGVADLKKAADAENADACYELAIWMLKQKEGHITDETFKKVLDLLKKAADQEHQKACHAIGCLLKKNHPDVAEKYFEIAAWGGNIAAMAELALLYNTEEKISDQLFWLDKMTVQGENGLLEKLPASHMISASKLREEAMSSIGGNMPSGEYSYRISLCREAIEETGKAYYWQKCVVRQYGKDDGGERSRIYKVQQELYKKINALSDMEHYAAKAKQLSEEIERYERTQAEKHARAEREARKWKLLNIEMNALIFGPEVGAFLLAKNFGEEIKNDLFMYCAITDIDPMLTHML